MKQYQNQHQRKNRCQKKHHLKNRTHVLADPTLPDCQPVDEPAPEVEEPQLDCESQGMEEQDGQCVQPEPELDCESQGMEEQDGQCVIA